MGTTATLPGRSAGGEARLCRFRTAARPSPGTIVVEYEPAGTVTTTGLRGAASFVAVLTVRDGKVVRWREYQNTAAIAAATRTLPALLAAYGDTPAG